MQHDDGTTSGAEMVAVPVLVQDPDVLATALAGRIATVLRSSSASATEMHEATGDPDRDWPGDLLAELRDGVDEARACMSAFEQLIGGADGGE